MIYYEADVGCDGRECCARFPGAGLYSHPPVAASAVWKAAAKAGWKTVGRNKHLCPDCAKRAGIQNLERPKGSS